MNSNLKRFNNQIDALITALKKNDALNNDKSINLFELKYQGIRSMDAKKPLECFLKFVYPYKEQIMNKNAEFFLGDNLTKRVNELHKNMKELDYIEENDNEFVLHQALNLKEHWTDHLSESEKNVVWTYFQVLIKLAERYVAEKVL